MQTTIDKVVHLSEDRSKRLGQMASASGTTEDALIERALDILFELSQRECETERRDWNAVGEGTLHRIWDNDADAVYDNRFSAYD